MLSVFYWINIFKIIIIRKIIIIINLVLDQKLNSFNYIFVILDIRDFGKNYMVICEVIVLFRERKDFIE